MKKSLRFCVLLALAATLLTVSAFADTGPKPQLTVKVTNPPEELYYLDLLAEGDWEHAGDADYSGLDWSYSEEEIAALDSGLLDALRAAVPDGWHACTAEGSNGAPMWGDLLGEDAGNGTRLHTFGYVGVPDTYRILLVTKAARPGFLAPIPAAAFKAPSRWTGHRKPLTCPRSGRRICCNFCAPSSLPC